MATIIDIRKYESEHSCDTCKYQNKSNRTCSNPMYNYLMSEMCNHPDTAHSRICRGWYKDKSYNKYRNEEMGINEDL